MSVRRIHDRKFLVKFLVLGAFALFQNSVRADFYVHSWEDQYTDPQTLRLAPELRYYSSKSNYDSNGNNVIPTLTPSYSQMGIDALVSYGLHPLISVYGRLNWERAEVDLANPVTSNTGYGFADQTLGLTIRAWQSEEPEEGPAHSRLDFQIQWDFPAYNNATTASSTPYLGDGANDLSFGGFFHFPFLVYRTGRYEAELGAAFTKRSGGLPSEMPWRIGANYHPFGHGFLVGAGFWGVECLSPPAPAGTATAITTSTSTGGDFITGSPGASIANVRGEVGYQAGENLEYHLSFSDSLVGKIAPTGFLVTAGATFRFALFQNPAENPAAQQPLEYSKSNRGFVDYNFQAKVLKSNDRLNLIKIDKGSVDGVQMGQTFDIFAVDSSGLEKEPVARAQCTAVKSNEAVLKVSEFFKETWIEEGFLVKRPLQ